MYGIYDKYRYRYLWLISYEKKEVESIILTPLYVMYIWRIYEILDTYMACEKTICDLGTPLKHGIFGNYQIFGIPVIPKYQKYRQP